jgi:hypothetical protein
MANLTLRDTLHQIADLLAEALTPNPLDGRPAQSERPQHERRKPRHRRAPPMPPVIEPTVAVNNANRERGRQALLRRGYGVRAEGRSDER